MVMGMVKAIEGGVCGMRGHRWVPSCHLEDGDML